MTLQISEVKAILTVCVEYPGINILRQKYNLNQEYPIITSGIGKDLLIKLLKPKKCRLLPFDDLITNSSDKLKTMAALHAPAFSVAHLLSTSK